MKKLGLFIFLLFIFTPVSFAETIYLKSGRSVEGKIVERTDKFIKVEIMPGAAVTYSLDGIEKIEGAQPVAITSNVEETVSESQGELYVNEDIGFEIRGANGWFKYLGPAGSKAKVMFSKYPKIENMKFPFVGVTVDVAPQNIDTAVGFANLVLPKYQASLEKTGATFTITEPVHEIEIAGQKGVRFVFEVSDKAGKGMKSLDCKFMQEGVVVSLQGMDSPQNFSENVNDFEEIISSFKFSLPEDNFKELEKLNKINPEFKPVENKEQWDVLKKQVLESIAAKKSFKTLFLLKDMTNQKLTENNYLGMALEMIYLSPQSFEFTNNDYYHKWRDIWRVDGKDLYAKIGVWVPQPDTGNPEIKKMMQARREAYNALYLDKYSPLIGNNEPIDIAEKIENKYTVLKFKTNQVNDLWTDNNREGIFEAEVFVWLDDEDKCPLFVKTLISGKNKEGGEVREEYKHYFSNFNYLFKLGKPELNYLDKTK